MKINNMSAQYSVALRAATVGMIGCCVLSTIIGIIACVYFWQKLPSLFWIGFVFIGLALIIAVIYVVFRRYLLKKIVDCGQDGKTKE